MISPGRPLQHKSTLLKIEDENRKSMVVDVMDRHKTFKALGKSQVLMLGEDGRKVGALQIDNQAPHEGDNLAAVDGFKNPYHRKRANSLLLRHESKSTLFLIMINFSSKQCHGLGKHRRR